MSLRGIPAIPITMDNAMMGAPTFPTRPLGLSDGGTTKKLCLCNLQRQKDAERAAQNKKPRQGY